MILCIYRACVCFVIAFMIIRCVC